MLLLFYGLCAWGALLNLPAWARLAWRRIQERARPTWWRDPYLLTRLGITSLALGTTGLAGSRAIAALTSGVPLSVPSPLGAVAIFLMAIAEPLFLRVDEIHARARGKWSLNWRLYWIGAVAWLAYILIKGAGE